MEWENEGPWLGRDWSVEGRRLQGVPETDIWGEVWRGDREWSEVGRLWVMVETQKEGSEVAPFPQQVEGTGRKLQSLSPRYP